LGFDFFYFFFILREILVINNQISKYFYGITGEKGAQCSSGGPVIDCAQRMRIAYDAAQGLKSLHQENIVHQNIKSSNVLLFEGFKAKLDFNIRNQFPDLTTHLNSTRVL